MCLEVPLAFSLLAVRTFCNACTSAAIFVKAVTDVAIVARSVAVAGSPSVGAISVRDSAIDLGFMPCSASNGLMPVVELVNCTTHVI